MFRFENLVVKNEDVPLVTPTNGLVPNMVHRLLKKQYNYGDVVPVMTRSAIVRVCFMKISATGMICALVATYSANPGVSFSCALAAGTNLVAAIHYAIIWAVRAQALSSAFHQTLLGRDKQGNVIAPSDDKPSQDEEQQKRTDALLFSQESAVDALRFSDWSTTLVLMTLELYKLIEYATNGAEPAIPNWVAAGLQPLMVCMGGVYKFGASELRHKKGGKVTCVQWMLGIGGFVASFALFSFILWAILDPLISQKCPPGSVASSCEITDALRQRDATAVYTLTLVWLGYPFVTLTSRLVQNKEEGVEYSQYNSVYKDVAYGALDVFSKGGLAIYAAMRSTWL